MSEETEVKADLGNQEKQTKGLSWLQCISMCLAFLGMAIIGLSWTWLEIKVVVLFFMGVAFCRINKRAEAAKDEQARNNVRESVKSWFLLATLVVVIGIGAAQNDSVENFLVSKDRIVERGSLIRPPLRQGATYPTPPQEYRIPVPPEVFGEEGPEDILLVFKVPVDYKLGIRCQDLDCWWSCDSDLAMSSVLEAAFGKKYQAFCRYCYASSEVFILPDQWQARIKQKLGIISLTSKKDQDIEYVGVINPNNQDDE